MAPSRAALIGFLVRSVGIPHAIALILGEPIFEQSDILTAPRIEPPVVWFAFLPAIAARYS